MKKQIIMCCVIMVFLSLFGFNRSIERLALPQTSFTENQGISVNQFIASFNVFCGKVKVTDEKVMVYQLTNKENQSMVFSEFINHESKLKAKDNQEILQNAFLYPKSSEYSNQTVDCGEIAKGIYLKLQAVNDNVEKLFYINPFANVENIQMSFGGVQKIVIDQKGELVCLLNNSRISFTAPIAYQLNEKGEKVYCQVDYRLTKDGYGFKIGDYDQSRELVIDPLISSTFIGSSLYDDDYGPSMERDLEGNIYLCGYTTADTFPYINGYDGTYHGGRDIFVAKFTPDLSTLLASTYIGGSGNEMEATMVFDQAKEHLYIAGYTTSSDFPVTEGAYNTLINGGQDVFVLKINKELTVLEASSFLGGSSNEGQQWPKLDIKLNANDEVYLTGLTCSIDFPFISGNVIDSVYAGGSNGGDAFLVKLDSNLTTLLGSTYIGGSANEWRMSIDLDQEGSVFVCGETESSDFGFTEGVYDNSFNGASDIFVNKYNSDLSVLEKSTALGRANYEEPLDIFVGDDSSVYVTGYTKSSNFPTTAGAYDRSFSGGDRDAYIAKFDNELTILQACTFLGGNNRDDLCSIRMNSSGNIVVAGNTKSSNLPCTDNAYNPVYTGGTDYGDVFVSVLNNDLTDLTASTYIGGQADDRALDLLFDTENHIYISGYTKSSDYPTTEGSFDRINAGGYGDCFISKLTADLTNDFIGNIQIEEPENKLNFNCYPNPFNPDLTIKFSVKKDQKATLSIFNIKGEKLAVIFDGVVSSGTHSKVFKAGQFSSGLYFCRLEMGTDSITQKILLMK